MLENSIKCGLWPGLSMIIPIYGVTGLLDNGRSLMATLDDQFCTLIIREKYAYSH